LNIEAGQTFATTGFTQVTADQPSALVMADVDHFKRVNDIHGHQVGDAILRELGQRLRQATQGKGSAYRYGGEEFAAILPNHTEAEALAVAERARHAVEASKVGCVAVTSSYGVAIAPLQASSAEQWLKKADEALYDAKHLGRNLVRLSGEPPPEAGKTKRPARKPAEPGTLSDEAKEKLRLQILRKGRALCPVDQVPLETLDMTGQGDTSRSYSVHCPGCGFNTELLGPENGAG
jgi:diguanylate cyclase (GGDEF)-like protein